MRFGFFGARVKACAYLRAKILKAALMRRHPRVCPLDSLSIVT